MKPTTSETKTEKRPREDEQVASFTAGAILNRHLLEDSSARPWKRAKHELERAYTLREMTESKSLCSLLDLSYEACGTPQCN